MSASCKKESPLSELSVLAPATQTGANTMGCLVNGGIFNTSNGFFSQHVYDSYAQYRGSYRFSLSGYRQVQPFVYQTVTLQTDSLLLKEGQTIPLTKAAPGYGSASYDVSYNPNNHDTYYTTANNPGALKITRLDMVNDILSGTFTFDGVNAAGTVVHITEGRFDIKYRPY
ncbi:MAG: hypothetical protein NVSMB24_36370 [Mucilaginibacter sp.]